MKKSDKVNFDIGKRIKLIRAMTGLNQEAFAKAASIGKSTLRQWETDALSGLSEKGADIIIDFVKSYNVEVSKLWLMENIGNPPILKPVKHNDLKEAVTDKSLEMPINQNEFIQKEIEFFKKTSEQSLVIEINNDLMSPNFLVGDLVGGFLVNKDKVGALVGQICIIKHEDVYIVRNILQGSESNKYIALTNKENNHPLINITIETGCIICRMWRIV